MWRTLSVCVCLGVVAVGASPLATEAQVRYTVTGLGFLPGGTVSDARAINDAGQIVGTSSSSANGNIAFIYANGVMTSLTGIESDAFGINCNGLVTGVYAISPSNSADAFLYDGTIHDLGVPQGYIGSYGFSVNASGTVVGPLVGGSGGTSFLYDGTFHTLSFSAHSINDAGAIVGSSNGDPVLYDTDGALQNLGKFGGVADGAANAINNLGEIVGYASASGGTIHAFAYEDGTMHDLGTLPGTVAGYATALNDQGVIVGDALSQPNNESRAFIVNGGVMQDLNLLIDSASEWDLEYARGINDSGQIVGTGIDPAGNTEAFLLTPFPEPTAATFVGLAACAALLHRRRRA